MKLSDMSVEELKKTPWFHTVDPARLVSLEDYAYWLEAILHNPCNLWVRDGEEFLIEIKQLVARVHGLKIEVYANEHPPPHFHVKSPNVDASFDIEDCRLIQGEVSGNDYRKIQFWHKHSKELLIQAWNSTRPFNCSVGQYGGT